MLQSSRHAFCILAHHEPKLLKALIEFLDHERIDIYVMVDAKTDISIFRNISTQKSKLTFCKNRVKVFWGHVSQIENEFNVFEEARKGGDYQYYHLLSGVDLPIKPLNYILDFFDKNSGKEFINIKTNDTDAKQIIDKKIKYYWPLIKYYYHPVKYVSWMACKIQGALLRLQKLIGINRSYPYSSIQFSDNWVSITQNLIDYIIPLKNQTLHNFRSTYTSDEIFLATLAWQSPYRNNISNTGCLRFVDWNRGEPYTWQEEDIPELLSSPDLFARKFSTATQPDIAAKLLSHL